ncbi:MULTISPECIES: 4'-phosphopantetheinyl transferase superfamily protein [unclassified Dehalobacter]|uniref:4'-phosphopantetheinyl transferase family protein n=1 Tax=unclassified Dehalobacter TaxID=2635733 RepID=UPI00037A4CD2|nr:MULTISPECIES: 4'-phosphopantetheinyl transferase superfamily protein [unclassified Dehalobacter]RJE47541.1 4'-phosphopantetheinyl transferase [Dehalobacter sp. MCB1]TCX48648.1 4'-phosphopantetheinyl transferase [Dehalobacter sp. 14DCB1]TCX56303.1 4'-phosphopantetheinyl transferase [Dehalobacter sp. 12DCB1]
MINIFGCNLACISENEINAYTQLISEKRKISLGRMKYIEDVKRSLLGELLIRKIVRKNYFRGNAEISFGVNDYGKPYVKDLEAFHFSIAHSGEWVVCATSDQKVGVDLEQIRPVDLEIARQHFTEQENRFLTSLSQDRKVEYFFKLWTLKESYLKAKGTGLAGNLKEADFSSMAGSSFSYPNEGLFFYICPFDPGYAVAACGCEKEFSPEVHEVNIRYSDF